MRPIEGFGIPGFFHPIDRRKSEKFVSFIYTTYRGIRNSGLFSDQIGPEIRVFLAGYFRKSGFFGQFALGNPVFFRFEKLPLYRGCTHIIWNSPLDGGATTLSALWLVKPSSPCVLYAILSAQPWSDWSVTPVISDTGSVDGTWLPLTCEYA